jgi:hypothetical protein
MGTQANTTSYITNYSEPDSSVKNGFQMVIQGKKRPWLIAKKLLFSFPLLPFL